jgi:hypothetical protein
MLAAWASWGSNRMIAITKRIASVYRFTGAKTGALRARELTSQRQKRILDHGGQ